MVFAGILPRTMCMKKTWVTTEGVHPTSPPCSHILAPDRQTSQLTKLQRLIIYAFCILYKEIFHQVKSKYSGWQGVWRTDKKRVLLPPLVSKPGIPWMITWWRNIGLMRKKIKDNKFDQTNRTNCAGIPSYINNFVGEWKFHAAWNKLILASIFKKPPNLQKQWPVLCFSFMEYLFMYFFTKMSIHRNLRHLFQMVS